VGRLIKPCSCSQHPNIIFLGAQDGAFRNSGTAQLYTVFGPFNSALKGHRI
jgi:hypothetical protein